VHKFLQDIEELLAKEFHDRNITFRMDMRYRGTARFDEGKMRRAIFNVARNAVEAMPEGGSFAIQVDQEGPNLVLELTDSRPGIPEEIQDRLFESFVTRGKKNGTGLGLAIVKKIVAEHGGDVTFRTS